ncbi:hypothetical protein NDU88_002138 [Pleurodeles waltl]|uniref:Uncharacterized protein n=1 Tax=Pleurodeles waltl TaxID=8319 RepID=A0AAV7KRA1_PLEWA|nr:hypothetical protein NDU88_002138 [Pleurodeles waltl]
MVGVGHWRPVSVKRGLARNYRPRKRRQDQVDSTLPQTLFCRVQYSEAMTQGRAVWNAWGALAGQSELRPGEESGGPGRGLSSPVVFASGASVSVVSGQAGRAVPPCKSAAEVLLCSCKQVGAAGQNRPQEMQHNAAAQAS